MNTKESVKKGIIYLITFPNGKIYVGQTVKSLSNRVESYKKEINCVSRLRPVVSALRKYGIENCKFEEIEVLENTTREKVGLAEQAKIKELQSLVTQKGYNIHEGGYGGDNFSNHPNKELIREKLKGRKPRLGAKLSEETKKKIGKKSKQRLKDKTKHPLWGKHHSDETKRKISDKHKGKYFGRYVKRLTKKQLLIWFEEGWNYLVAYKKFGVGQKILEDSLLKHYGTKSLEKAINLWRKDLKGFNHKGKNRNILTIQQLDKAFRENWSTRETYKEYNTNQKALSRETMFHFGTKSWEAAKRIWKENLPE